MNTTTIADGNYVILEGAISVLSMMHSNPQKIYKIMLKNGIKNKNAGEILTVAKVKNIKVEIVPAEKIEKLAEGKTHGGVIALAAKREFPKAEDMLASLISPAFAAKSGKRNLSIAIIEGIEDPYNLGYTVRALYTQGVDALVIQTRDLVFSESVIEKASTGTFSLMNIAAIFHKSEDEKVAFVQLLKDNGFKIYCIDKRKDAESVFSVRFAERTAFIIGGEKRGVSRTFLNVSDKFVQIPYNCDKNFPYSLSAQTAATIISYEIHRQISLKNANSALLTLYTNAEDFKRPDVT